MTLVLTPDQQMLGDAIDAFLRDHYSLEQRMKSRDSTAGWRPEIWRSFANDLGILGVGLPEELGGTGGDGMDQFAVARSLGRALVIEPYVETVILAGGLLARSEAAHARDLVARIVSGDAVIACALDDPGQAKLGLRQAVITANGGAYMLRGSKAVVVGAQWADVFLVSARLDNADDETVVAAIPADTEGIRRQDYRTLDGRRASELMFEGLSVGESAILYRGEAAELAVEQAIDRAIAAICAEAVGIMERLVSETIDYLKQRRQFGVALATFQALQHRVADMHCAVEMATAIAMRASSSLDATRNSRKAIVSAAKAQVAKACCQVGQSAVQLHGGMGMTDELSIGHLFKRTTVIERQFGDASDHLIRFANIEDHGLI